MLWKVSTQAAWQDIDFLKAAALSQGLQHFRRGEGESKTLLLVMARAAVLKIYIDLLLLGI